MWKLISIINKNNLQEVCSYYLGIPIDLHKSIIILNIPLRIAYKRGSYFTHEKVTKIQKDKNIITIETTKKLWILQNNTY